jgi:hypothetical protein
MSQRKKTEYERVRDVWYKKLEDQGFDDIEYRDGSLRHAKGARSVTWERDDLKQLVQDYYCMAYHFLNDYQFDTELDKIIWEYHTNGISVRNIAKLLNEAKVCQTDRNHVWKTIKKLEVIMKGLYLSA